MQRAKKKPRACGFLLTGHRAGVIRHNVGLHQLGPRKRDAAIGTIRQGAIILAGAAGHCATTATTCTTAITAAMATAMTAAVATTMTAAMIFLALPTTATTTDLEILFGFQFTHDCLQLKNLALCSTSNLTYQQIIRRAKAGVAGIMSHIFAAGKYMPLSCQSNV